MAFDKPKEDPAAKQRAELAEEDRVKTLQEDLLDITAARARKFGQALRGGLTSSTTPSQSQWKPASGW